MVDEGDFIAYVEARWPALVRSLVLLGSPLPEAVEVAERGLARCRLSWRAIRAAEDMDVEVYTVVLAERDRVEHDRAAPASQTTAARVDGTPVPVSFSRPGPAVMAGPVDAVLLLESLLAALDRLEAVVRSTVVLRHGAGLSVRQVADVLQADPFVVEGWDASAVAELDPEELVRLCR